MSTFLWNNYWEYSTKHYPQIYIFTIHYLLEMADIQFTVGDKELADAENNKLSKIQNIIEESDLSPEDMTLISKAIFEWANDSMAENHLEDEDDA